MLGAAQSPQSGGKIEEWEHQSGGWLRENFALHGRDKIEETLKLQWLEALSKVSKPS